MSIKAVVPGALPRPLTSFALSWIHAPYWCRWHGNRCITRIHNRDTSPADLPQLLPRFPRFSFIGSPAFDSSQDAKEYIVKARPECQGRNDAKNIEMLNTVKCLFLFQQDKLLHWEQIPHFEPCTLPTATQLPNGPVNLLRAVVLLHSFSCSIFLLPLRNSSLLIGHSPIANKHTWIRLFTKFIRCFCQPASASRIT